jgi:hypothetical protein
MNIFDFIERFPGEQESILYFIETRQKVGVLCQKCGCMKHIWLADIDRFECEKCGNQIGIKSGTLMENSKLPIKHWFVAIQLLTSSDNNFSIAEIQEKISGAEPKEVRESLETLKDQLYKLKNGPSFDQLLLACVVRQEHSPVTTRSLRTSNNIMPTSINQHITELETK